MINKNNPIAAATIIRLFSFLACVSLLAACLLLIIRAPSLDRPAPQFAVAGLTFVIALLAFYGGSTALNGRRGQGIAILGGITVILILLPTLRFVPGLFTTAYQMDLEALFPPLWVYCAAIPLLLFVLFELTLENRGEGGTPLISLFVPLVSGMIVIFTGATLMGILAAGLLDSPIFLFNGFLAPVAIAGLMGLGAILARKGMVVEGMAILVAVGLLVEWLSVLFYATIPNFIGDHVALIWQFTVFDRLLPVLPIIGGTIPGAVTALSGLVLLKTALARQRDRGQQPAEVSLVDWLQQSAREFYRPPTPET